MPKPASVLPPGTRTTDKISLGYFASVFPRTEVWRSLQSTNRGSKRERDLPNHLVVYFVLFMSIFREANQQEVLSLFFECARWLFGPMKEKPMARSSISQARSRVGFEPLKDLFDRLAKPLATEDKAYAFFKGRRITALDGSLFSVADSAENRIFGRANGPNGPGAFPQSRLVSLVECGTHATFAAAVGGYKDSEQSLARSLFGQLSPGMVCLADRNFLGTDIFREASASGALLVWRATKTFTLPVEESLPDGSYLSTMYAHTDKKRERPLRIRVIEYMIQGVKDDPIRLVTNWFDYKEASADELARLYSQRWEYESTMREIKSDLNANEIVLRSQTPDLVKQELYGLLLSHYAIRSVMHEAAAEERLDDDVLSFSHAVSVIRRKAPMFGVFPPSTDSRADSTRNSGGARLVQSWAI